MLAPALAFADPVTSSEATSPPPPPAPPAPAPPAAPTRLSHPFQLGLRLGYSLPIGPLGTQADGLGSDISDLQTAAVPIAFDAGRLVRPWFYLGGSIAWAPGTGPSSTGSTCASSGVHCFRQDLQLLADARVYLAPEARVTGWMSVDAGWELATFATSVQGTTITSTYSGPIFVDGRIGFEAPVGAMTIAPYLGVAVGEFVTRGLNPASTPVTTWIATANHEWVTLGVRGSYWL